MKYEYKPKGVCSQKMIFEIDDDKITSFTAIGGCNGNLKGISKLLQGMNIDEVIEKLEGTTCGFKNTSCPDQISKALKEYKQTL